MVPPIDVSVKLIPMKPREILSAFDRYLAARALRFEGVVVAGAALNLIGVVSWPTKDCDILHPDLHVRATLEDLGKRLGHAV